MEGSSSLLHQLLLPSQAVESRCQTGDTHCLLLALLSFSYSTQDGANGHGMSPGRALAGPHVPVTTCIWPYASLKLLLHMGVAHELPACPALGDTAIPPLGFPMMCQGMMSLATEGPT